MNELEHQSGSRTIHTGFLNDASETAVILL
jgi:hypothetical protein